MAFVQARPTLAAAGVVEILNTDLQGLEKYIRLVPSITSKFAVGF